ncbi:uncharacterized protein LY89DRAFT_193128 [Mollisia scopiformis]|uniref:Uncharacterized protein n=1 Tax=Mollisia scopiformis TaxID=149040 RepID=A0A194WXT4_MOLSC|nr:uncharacterized protein LY89DRAFT_193128 [Mollisia scopiformis]KUJ12786.1 hypothetical protein LY89DRAFT_193128 [Mollisia scopiformis]
MRPACMSQSRHKKKHTFFFSPCQRCNRLRACVRYRRTPPSLSACSSEAVVYLCLYSGGTGLIDHTASTSNSKITCQKAIE